MRGEPPARHFGAFGRDKPISSVQDLIVITGKKIVGALLLVIAGSVICYSQQTALRGPVAEAEKTFQTRCSTCHAEHGEGSEVGASLNVPDLRSPFVQKSSDAQLHQIIKNGKGNMPMFGRDFSDPQIDRIIELIRSFAAPPSQQSQAGFAPQ
ncbi:cytochrome c [Acidobacteria bacterium AB60]|nr:cytochrome c [Acidobacteria bacterium AB60]